MQAAGPVFGLGGLAQAKLVIGAPDDPYEREADAVAERVVAGQAVPSISGLQASAPGEAPQSDGKAKGLQRKCAVCGSEDHVQRKCATCEHEAHLQRKCAACEAEERLQRKCAACEHEAMESAEPVQARTQRSGGAAASPGMASAARQAIRSHGPGTPMQPATRHTLETRLGVDLREVRVHEDARSNAQAASLKARAFTHRNHIWLGPGETQSDLRLMAHETTHVVQQRTGRTPVIQKQDADKPPQPAPKSTAEIDLKLIKKVSDAPLQYLAELQFVDAEGLFHTYAKDNGLLEKDADDGKGVVYAYDCYAYLSKATPIEGGYSYASGELPPGLYKVIQTPTVVTGGNYFVVERTELPKTLGSIRIGKILKQTWEQATDDKKEKEKQPKDTFHVKALKSFMQEGNFKFNLIGLAEEKKSEEKDKQQEESKYWQEDIISDIPSWFNALREEVNKLHTKAKADEPKATDLPEKLRFVGSRHIQEKLGFGPDAWVIVIHTAASEPQPPNLIVKKERVAPAIEKGELGKVAADVFKEIRSKVTVKKSEGQAQEQAAKKAKQMGTTLPPWLHFLLRDLNALLAKQKLDAEKAGTDLAGFPDRLSVDMQATAHGLDFYLQVWVLVDSKWVKGVLSLLALDAKTKAADLVAPVQQMARALRAKKHDVDDKPKEDLPRLPAYPARIVPQNLDPRGTTTPGAENTFRMVLDYESIWGRNLLHLTTIKMGLPVYHEWALHRIPDDLKDTLSESMDPSEQSGALSRVLETESIQKKSGLDWEFTIEMPQVEADYLLFCWAKPLPDSEFAYRQPPSGAFFRFTVKKGSELAKESVRQVPNRIAEIENVLKTNKQLKANEKEALEKELKRLKEEEQMPLDKLTTGNLEQTTTLLDKLTKLKRYLDKQPRGPAHDPITLRLIREDDKDLYDTWRLIQSLFPKYDEEYALKLYIENVTEQKKYLTALSGRIKQHGHQIEGVSHRVVATLVEEETGTTYPLILVVGQKPGEPLHTYRILDLTLPQMKPGDRIHDGEKKDNPKDAIKSAFVEFGKDSKYGTGDIYYRVPTVPDTEGHVPSVKTPISYLEDLAMILGFVALGGAVVVSGGTLGPVAAGIAMAIGVSSAVVSAGLAVRNIAQRAGKGTLEADAELALDLIDILSASLVVFSAARAAAGTVKNTQKVGEIVKKGVGAAGPKGRTLLSLEHGLLIYEAGEAVATGTFVYFKVQNDIEEIRKLGLSKEEEEALIQEAVSEGIKTGAIIVASGAPTVADLAARASRSTYKSFRDKRWLGKHGWTEQAPPSLRHGNINKETRDLLHADPAYRARWAKADPEVAKLLKICESPCLPQKKQISDDHLKRLEKLLETLGVPGDHLGLREYFHRRRKALNRAVDDLETAAKAPGFNLDAFLKKGIATGHVRETGASAAIGAGGRWVYTKPDGTTRIHEYEIRRHGSQPGTENFFQSHHGIQGQWAQDAGIPGYRYDDSPAILLRDSHAGSPHRIITDRQSNRRNTRSSRTYADERDLLKADMDAAGVPPNVRDELLKKSDAYFGDLYKKARAAGTPEPDLKRMFGTWKPS